MDRRWLSLSRRPLEQLAAHARATAPPPSHGRRVACASLHIAPANNDHHHQCADCALRPAPDPQARLPRAPAAAPRPLTFRSGYSAHEHSSTSAAALPLDITLETVVASLLLLLGIVLSGAGSLRPISLRVWTGKLEREKGAGPFSMLEERLGFLNIGARRDEFAAWSRASE